MTKRRPDGFAIPSANHDTGPSATGGVLAAGRSCAVFTRRIVDHVGWCSSRVGVTRMSGFDDRLAIRVVAAVELPRQCPACWGQRAIWEPSVLGLVPLVCEVCAGKGRVNS
jgi:hypothetical protein